MDEVFPNDTIAHLRLKRYEDAAITIMKHDTPLPQPMHKTSDIDDSTDAQLIALARSPRITDFGVGHTGTNNVKKITENTVLKLTYDPDPNATYPAEALAQQLIFEQTSIPVPNVYRVFMWDHKSYIAIEHVPGEQLLLVWPRLSWLARLRVAVTLRSYVQQLRQVRHSERETIPGPLGMPGERGLEGMSNMWHPLVPERGPFHSYADFTGFFHERMELLKRVRRKQNFPMPHLVGKMDDSEPLVLTHQDLNPRNILVGEDGRLWLIDFGMTGFYPPWVEFVTMRIQSRRANWCKEELEVWGTMIPFVCGWYREQDEWFKRMEITLAWRHH